MTDRSDSPASLFAGWLEEHERSEGPAFDTFCARHPEHANDLRALHAEHLRQQVPPTVDVAADGNGGAGDTWEAFLEQLRSRGPNFERYVVEGEVARGGMGAIHRVFDQDVRRHLALKVMLDEGDLSADDGSLGRFLEEAQVTGQLDHPGIVPVHEVGVDGDGRAYFTMKLVKGEDLRAVFDRVANPSDLEWTTTRALGVMLRVCEAMAYAHAKGVIHRDLKPGNVMVGRFGEAYVMDWGLAKVVGCQDHHDLRLKLDATDRLKTDRQDAAAQTPDSPILTIDGTIVGTPAYMPPEQALGEVNALGPAADVYAVGAVLYQLLSGRMPYTRPDGAMTPRTILALVTHGPPPPLATLAPDAPAELIAIVEEAMAREISDRYPNMTALARDLRAYMENRVVSAYETGAWAELKKWVRRNKALATTAAAALLLVLVLAGWALVERETARKNEQTANSERDHVLRLSDKRRLDVLLSDADTLWPAHPEKVDALKGWLSRASTLLENLPGHEATLAEVRATGAPLPDPRDGDLAALREHLANHEIGEEFEEEAFDEAGALAEHQADLSAAIASLDATIARERGYDFGENAEARWWHDAVRDLVVWLHALGFDDVNEATVAGVEARLSWAESVAERTMTGADVVAKWAEAKEAIRAHPKYGGLELKPQIGLVPLGPDPDSTLWEFGHLRTGDIPARDPVTRKLAIAEATGLVFVLIPSGTYRIGAQNEDENAPHYDPQAASNESPVHEVTLSPYMLSKYEMTQGQWMRFTGENPSWYESSYPSDTTPRSPIENVSWLVCEETMARLGLDLPTEAQWEAACRAGTRTPWSAGADADSLAGAANVADATFARVFKRDNAESFDDGFDQPAAVGSLAPNSLGLHDMHGNVWEWCRDGYGAYTTPTQPGDALRVHLGATNRVSRGGSYSSNAFRTRSAYRARDAAENRINILGCRPAKRLSTD